MEFGPFLKASPLKKVRGSKIVNKIHNPQLISHPALPRSVLPSPSNPEISLHPSLTANLSLPPDNSSVTIPKQTSQNLITSSPPPGVANDSVMHGTCFIDVTLSLPSSEPVLQKISPITSTLTLNPGSHPVISLEQPLSNTISKTKDPSSSSPDPLVVVSLCEQVQPLHALHVSPQHPPTHITLGPVNIDVIVASFGEEFKVSQADPSFPALSTPSLLLPASSELDPSVHTTHNPKRVTWKRNAREKGKKFNEDVSRVEKRVGGKRCLLNQMECMDFDKLESISKRSKCDPDFNILTNLILTVSVTEHHRREQ